MNPPTDFNSLLALILAQLAPLAPYLASGAVLSHILAQFVFIDKKETPDWQKIGAAYVLALIATGVANILKGGYAGGDTFGTYAWSTIQQSGYLLGTMTITNVSMDKFIPSLAQWGATTLTRLIVAIRKGVDTLINQGKPAPVTANG